MAVAPGKISLGPLLEVEKVVVGTVALEVYVLQNPVLGDPLKPFARAGPAAVNNGCGLAGALHHDGCGKRAVLRGRRWKIVRPSGHGKRVARDCGIERGREIRWGDVDASRIGKRAYHENGNQRSSHMNPPGICSL